MGIIKPVVMYHHIKDDYKYGMTAVGFKNQIAKYRNRCIFSFDDGLKEHYTVAFPLLKKFGLSGYFFPIGETLKGKFNHINKCHILTNVLGEKIIDYWNMFSDYGCLAVNANNKYWFDSDKLMFFKDMLLTVPYAEKNRVFDAILDKVEIILPEVSDYYMTKSELKEMRDAGMIIGNHGMKHLAYKNVSSAVQREDIVTAHRLLWKPDVFTYPYGSYDGNTLSILKSLGYKLGLTTESSLEVGRTDCRCLK